MLNLDGQWVVIRDAANNQLNCDRRLERDWFTEAGSSLKDMMKKVEWVSNPAPNEWDGFGIWTALKAGEYRLGRIFYKSCAGPDPVDARRELLSNLVPKPGMDFYLFKKDVQKSPR